MNNPLIEKLKNQIKFDRLGKYTNDEIELIVAVVNGDFSPAAAGKLIKSSRQSIQGCIGPALRLGVSKGIVKIEFIKK